MCFCIGQFIGAGVLKGLINRPGQWSYRIPFAIQWIWPPFLLVAGFFMPESPYWYIRKGQRDKAEKVMQRVMAPSQRHNAKAVVAMMEHTNAIEREITEGTSYLDCFRGVDRRRTEIACIVFLAQITCGIQFAFSATYFFEQAGLSADNAYKLNLGGTAIAFVGTLAAWFLINHFGRRVLWLTGFVGMCAALLIIGFLTLSSNPAVGWAQAAFCLVWLATFSTTGGPIGWMIPAEISSTRLRPKTVVLARNSYYVGQTVSTIIEPYMVNPTAWNWKGKTGFFWFGTGIVTLAWGYFRLPETKDRTYEELDIMFASKLPTRRFKEYKVNAYDETVEISERAQQA
jgi:SP family general alpha glucoside:H+ symporter-like MFS transporter